VIPWYYTISDTCSDHALSLSFHERCYIRYGLPPWAPPPPRKGSPCRSAEKDVQQVARARQADAKQEETHEDNNNDDEDDKEQEDVGQPLEEDVGCQPQECNAMKLESSTMELYRADPFGGLAGRSKLDPAPQGFVNLVTLCSFMGTHGLAKRLLPHLAYLIAKFGGDVGHSNHHPDFMTSVEHHSDELIHSSTLKVLQTPLPATGQPPDVTLILDAGVIGKYYHHYRDGCLTVGLIFPVRDPPYRVALLLDILVETADGRREAVVALLEKAFRPLGGLQKWLDLHIALMCGDGAYIPGGSDARHKGGLLKDFGAPRPSRNWWDDFHTLNKAMEHAVKQSAMMEQFFRMLNLGLEHMFLAASLSQ